MWFVLPVINKIFAAVMRQGLCKLFNMYYSTIQCYLSGVIGVPFFLQQ